MPRQSRNERIIQQELSKVITGALLEQSKYEHSPDLSIYHHVKSLLVECERPLYDKFFSVFERYKHARVIKGLAGEVVLFKTLEWEGYPVSLATPAEDMYEGIDLFIGTIPVQVKVENAKMHNPIVFSNKIDYELYVMNAVKNKMQLHGLEAAFPLFYKQALAFSRFEDFCNVLTIQMLLNSVPEMEYIKYWYNQIRSIVRHNNMLENREQCWVIVISADDIDWGTGRLLSRGQLDFSSC